MKEYKEITMDIGSTLRDAYCTLQYYKKRGVDACTNFNDKMLNSDMTLDDIYELITGKTYAEFEYEQFESRKRTQEEKDEFQKNLPELEKYWIEEGKKFITKEYENYVKCVPIRLRDLYHGLELKYLKELAEPINNKEYKKAVELLGKQGHSGMSYGLIKSMIMAFLENGNEFIKYLGGK